MANQHFMQIMGNRWTIKEKDELARLYSAMTAKQIAEHLGRPVSYVSGMANKMGLHKEQPNTIHLTREQELWLKLNFPHMATAICAIYLGISHRSVVRKARSLGLRKTEQFMKDAQLFAIKRANESNLRNGTYPPKGVVNANIAKGAPYRFKPGYRKKSSDTQSKPEPIDKDYDKKN